MGEIAYVASYLGGAGGSSKSAVDVLVAILLAGHAVTVISNTGRRCRLPSQVNGLPVPPPSWITPNKPFPAGFRRGYARGVASWFVSAVQDPLWANRLRRLAPPVLTIVNGFSQILLDQVCEKNPGLGRKTAIVVRGAPKEITFQAAGLSVNWALGVLEKHDFLIFVSSQVEQAWLAYPTLASKASFCIPNCCREDMVSRLMVQERAHVRDRLGLPSGKLVAVCVASIQPRKGQDLLLQNFPRVLEAAPDLMMYLIGPVNSPWARSLQRQIRASGWSDRLRVLGAKSNAMDYIYVADILLMPSRAEALPRTLLEAMALKTPIIASDVDGIPELIEHRRGGLLFSPAEPSGLVDAFAEMAADQGLRKDLAERAHERYWSSFSQSLQIERYKRALGVMTGTGPT